MGLDVYLKMKVDTGGKEIWHPDDAAAQAGIALQFRATRSNIDSAPPKRAASPQTALASRLTSSDQDRAGLSCCSAAGR